MWGIRLTVWDVQVRRHVWSKRGGGRKIPCVVRRDIDTLKNQTILCGILRLACLRQLFGRKPLYHHLALLSPDVHPKPMTYILDLSFNWSRPDHACNIYNWTFDNKKSFNQAF